MKCGWGGGGSMFDSLESSCSRWAQRATLQGLWHHVCAFEPPVSSCIAIQEGTLGV